MSNMLGIILRDFCVTAFQIWCLGLLMVNEKVKTNKHIRRMFFLFLTITVVTLSLLDVHVFAKFFVLICLVVLLGKYIYDCSRAKLLLYGCILVVTEFSSEIIIIQLWNWFNKPVYTSNIMYEDFTANIVIMILTIYFVIMFLLGKVIKRNRDKIKMKEMYSVFISGIPFMIVLLGIHVSLPKIHDAGVRHWFLISSVGVFFAFVFNVIYMQNYLEMIERNRESECAVAQLKLKNEYYLQKLQTEEKIKEIYHDLKNYFLFSDDFKISSELKKKLSLYERFYETGNDFLNIILAEKINKAYEDDIRIECHVDFSKGDFMEALDISTIFGNLLDNALEATEKIEEGEKYIFIDVAVKRKFMILVVRNNMNNFIGNKLKTDKWNSTYHGYGLKNVRNAVKKYEGEMKVSIDGKEFRVNVVIPIPQK